MDLLIKNGRVVDPARKLDTVADLVIRNGMVGAIGNEDTAVFSDGHLLWCIQLG